MNLPGFGIAQAQQADRATWFSSDLDDHQFLNWPYAHTAATLASSGAAPTDNLPVSVPAFSVAGDGPVHSFLPDYYFRIHVIPQSIDLGNLVADRQIPVEVWNAYYASKTLSALDIVNGSGLLFTDPIAPPTDYSPLESRMHTLDAFVTGPPVVDSTITFTFPAEAPVLTIIGSRVSVWPFGPQWDRPVLERLAWLTDVLEAYDGTEQTRELRSVPRKSITYNCAVFREDRQHLDSLLWDWQARRFLLPIPMDVGVLEQAASVDDLTLYISTANLSYHAGGYVVLYTGPISTEAAQIADVQPGWLTLEAGVRADWPKGALVFPANLARISEAQQISSFAEATAEFSMEFSLEETANVTASDSPSSYRGYPVLEEQPNWREDVSLEYRRLVHRLDNKLAPPGINDPRPAPTPIQSFMWTKAGRTSVEAFRAWLHARKGRLNPLWVPTFTRDITLTQQVLSAQAVMTVKRREYYRYLTGNVGRRDIAIFLHDGTIVYKRISGSTLLNQEEEQLVLTSTMGQDISPAQVYRISFIQLSRMESDTVELAWQNTGVIECTHMLRGLPDDV